MKEVTFIIPCHNLEGNGYIVPCVESIRVSNPNADIIVIDSASPDKSYFSKIDAPVLDINNKNYAFGAYWAGFRERRESEFYVFTHDSTIFRGEITKREFGIKPITPFYWFANNYSTTWAHMNQWVLDQAKLHGNYNPIGDQICLFCGIFAATNKFMTKLESDGISNIKPTIKMEAAYADEVLWSVIAANNGQSIRDNSYYGEAVNILSDDKLFWKFSGLIEKGRR